MNKIIIRGDIPSKKNNKQIYFNRKTKKRFISSSINYKNWHIEQSYRLKKQKIKNIKKVQIVFFPKTKRLFDLTNKAESIMDLLVDNGVIEDDNYSIIPKISLEIGSQDKEYPRTEILID